MLTPHLVLGAVVACLLAGTSGYIKGRSDGADKCEAALVALEKAALAEEVKAAEKSAEVVDEYVTRLEAVDVPEPVVRDRLVERLCGPDSHSPVPGTAAGVDARPTTNSGPGFAGALASDAGACARNAEQLRALIQWVRINSGAE